MGRRERGRGKKRGESDRKLKTTRMGHFSLQISDPSNGDVLRFFFVPGQSMLRQSPAYQRGPWFRDLNRDSNQLMNHHHGGGKTEYSGLCSWRTCCDL